MKVEDLMTREVRTLSPQDSAEAAARIMWEEDCGCVPVVDDKGGVIGMITDRDICMAAYTQGAPLAAIRLGNAMAKNVHTCGPKGTVASAERLMREHRVRRLPVVGADRRLVGILSLNDIAREAARSRGRKPKPPVTAQELSETLAAICQPRAAAVATAV